MVISSILTIHVENIRAPVPSNRTRPRSVPTSSSKSPKRSRNHSHKERKRRPHRQVYIPDKPPFVNFASAYINPYRYLTPILIDHNHQSKSRKSSKRKQKKQEIPNESINTTETNQTELNSSSTEIIQNTEPIDISSSDPNSYHMDFIRKRQIAIDNTSYREIIRTWKPSSIQQLVTLIKDLTLEKNILDRVWIIYYWISQNILFDTNADDDNPYFQQKPDEIFRYGKTKTSGYTIIFKALCDNLGIKCIQIFGYVKDSHYEINQTKFSHPNHIWNAVELDGNHWYLIDTVWGSGYLNNKYEYKKDLQIFYFLTRPEQMIYNHLPEDSQWQLLSKRISMLEYSRLPYLHSYYFIYDLTLISPRFSNMVYFDPIESYGEVLIQAPNDINLACLIKDNIKSTSLCQYDTSRQIWQCLFAPYKIGFYTLIIFANRTSTSHVLSNVIELGIEITAKDFLKRKVLPITFGKFIEYKCQIYAPLDGIIKRGMTITIHCRIPNAACVRISIDGIWLDEMLIKDDIFKEQITVPEHEIIVYAQFKNKKSINHYDGLIRYLVEK